MQRLKNSQWGEALRTRILKAGTIGWFRILNKEINEDEPRYRHVDYKREDRDLAKAAKKDNWFKSSKLPADKQANAVLIVDASPGGEVKSIFEKEIAKSTLNIRVVERPGMKQQFIAMATNENPKPKCPPSTCLICDTEKGGYCRAKEVVYEVGCKECECKYDGQTGRNGKTRALEHQAKAKSQDPKVRETSFMARHQDEDHDGKDPGWNMKIIDRCPKELLKRLLIESSNIINRDKQLSLNSKIEMAKSNLVQVNFISDSKQGRINQTIIKQALEDKRNTKKATKPQPNAPPTKPESTESTTKDTPPSKQHQAETPPKTKENDPMIHTQPPNKSLTALNKETPIKPTITPKITIQPNQTKPVTTPITKPSFSPTTTPEPTKLPTQTTPTILQMKTPTIKTSNHPPTQTQSITPKPKVSHLIHQFEQIAQTSTPTNTPMRTKPIEKPTPNTQPTKPFNTPKRPYKNTQKTPNQKTPKSQRKAPKTPKTPQTTNTPTTKPPNTMLDYYKYNRKKPPDQQ